MKRYQSMNMRNLYNNISAGIVLLLIILLVSLFLSFTVEAIEEEPQPYDYSQFYTESNDIVEYYIRHSINDKIKEVGIERIISFYNQFTGSRTISQAIIIYAIEHEIPVNIMFSIAWKESRFDPRAINWGNRNGSSDWGLFQLNNQYTPFTREQFFNIYDNTNRAAEILSELIERTDGDLIKALYSYNAGYTRVVINNDIPASTREYVTDIIDYEDMLNQEFNKWIKQLV